jgi:hypothetical protein
MFTNAIVEQACLGYPVSSDLCADEIERRIIQAYIQLVFQSVGIDNSRAIAVLRLRSLEVRLVEMDPAHINRHLPPFWIEVIDVPTDTSIDSLGFHDFDEDELAAAVEMIVSAAHDAGVRNGSHPH